MDKDQVDHKEKGLTVREIFHFHLKYKYLLRVLIHRM